MDWLIVVTWNFLDAKDQVFGDESLGWICPIRLQTFHPEFLFSRFRFDSIQCFLEKLVRAVF